MNSVLLDRLQQARRRLFVGRATEISSWTAELEASEWNIPIWYVQGLGGMGKTTLLREWKRAAKAADMSVVTLDARDFDPTSEAFLSALIEALSEIPGIKISPDSSHLEICAALGELEGRFVIQVDTYELLAPLDNWFRETFLPHLPANTAVNMAGRNPLPMAWHGDGGWQELTHTFDLSALSSDESTEYLEKRGIVVGAHANLLSWAHGHPLALSLAADVWFQKPDLERNATSPANDFKPGDVPQLVGSLLEHLVNEVPTPAHRAALEACATVAVMTEELLCDMLVSMPVPETEGQSASGAPKVRALFEWLRSLSVIQSNRFGLLPHDLVREVLVADLRWRNPQWQAQLHSNAREHYLRRIHHSSGGEQQRAIFDCLFLHRMSPAVAPYLQWNDSRCSLDAPHPGDIEACLDWVERHEGTQSRQIARHWFAAQPENLTVIRKPNGEAQGFVFQLALHAATPDQIESDPATASASKYLRENAPLRTGERCTFFRFWMDKDEYQNVGATQSIIFVQAARHYLTTPQLAFTFFPCNAPEFWSHGFAYADLQRLPAVEFDTDGRHFGVFCHDWRSRPVLAWIDLLTQREIQSVTQEATPIEEPVPEPTFRVLDEAAFQGAVRQALRGWSEPAVLRRSLLLGTALVQRRARRIAAKGQEPNSDETVLALRSLLRETVAALSVAPRQDRGFRALELVYGRRTLSQEAAADVMNVSHSSFRRYLRSALNFISESLWQRETARAEHDTPLPPGGFENERNLNLF